MQDIAIFRNKDLFSAIAANFSHFKLESVSKLLALLFFSLFVFAKKSFVFQGGYKFGNLY